MLKILLISDTHGKLDHINQLATATDADLVIHAGDFGFYDEKSVHRLQTRELRLLVIYSPHRSPTTQNLNREELIEVIQQNDLLGHFPAYLKGDKEFAVPVYAVWGNHDDHEVVEALRADNPVKNLYLLDENHQYTITDGQQEAFQLYGLGGNFLVNSRTYTSTFQGRGGKIQMTFDQLGTLCSKIKSKKLHSIFVSHVSPGKEPLLTRLITHFTPNFWISGHMGSPFPCVWNQKTIHQWTDIEHWMSDLPDIEDTSGFSAATQLALDLLQAPLKNHGDWVQKTWNINLPDVDDGHALLTYDQNRFYLETHGSFTP